MKFPVAQGSHARYIERVARPCTHCGGRITARLVPPGQEWEVRCGRCFRDDGISFERTWRQLRDAGYAIPGIIEQKLQTKEDTMAIVKRPEEETEVRYALALRADSKPRDLAKFAGEISPVEVQKALALVAYGFDTNLHLQLYQGRVIISKDGALSTQC